MLHTIKGTEVIGNRHRRPGVALAGSTENATVVDQTLGIPVPYSAVQNNHADTVAELIVHRTTLHKVDLRFPLFLGIAIRSFFATIGSNDNVAIAGPDPRCRKTKRRSPHKWKQSYHHLNSTDRHVIRDTVENGGQFLHPKLFHHYGFCTFQTVSLWQCQRVVRPHSLPS